jgi:protocatechuate 3,4-dioxygenase beta subunit
MSGPKDPIGRDVAMNEKGVMSADTVIGSGRPGNLAQLDMRLLDPPYDSPGYRSTTLRAPTHPPLVLPPGPSDAFGPVFGEGAVGPRDHDLTCQHDGQPQGQRISIEGRLLDTSGRPIAGQLLEVWQANAAGRYRHAVDNHPAPIDPNFTGYGRCLTDGDGRYRFVTIRPGSYPWNNHPNAWRPAHVHFSVFGRAFTDRLVTQMYFPDDPLIPYDTIFNAVTGPEARASMMAAFDLQRTEPQRTLGYRFDIVVGGPAVDAATHGGGLW